MSATAINTYRPDYAVHPGAILEERLEAIGMKKTEFAQRCQISPKTVSLIVAGKAPLSPENAIQFERVLGVSADVWNNLDAHYRLHAVRTRVRSALADATEWAKAFPIQELVKRGQIEKPLNDEDAVRKLLRFLGVANRKGYDAWYTRLVVAYRKSNAHEVSEPALACWLRIGELRAEVIETAPFQRDEFQRALTKIRSLTRTQPRFFVPRMKEQCARAGVALVFESELPKTRISGAARWLASDKALIQLSLRYKTDDKMWFTFFHEAAHLLLHGKKLVFIDSPEGFSGTAEEEANAFAANTLLPPDVYNEFRAIGRHTKRSIEAFAEQNGIAPGIVVGRLQHDRILRYNQHNGIKKTFALRD